MVSSVIGFGALWWPAVSEAKTAQGDGETVIDVSIYSILGLVLIATQTIHEERLL